MKRFYSRHLCVIIALVLILQSVIIPVSFADGGTAVILGSAEAELGEEVTIALDIKNNTSVASLRLWLSYDKNMITPVSISRNTAFGGSLYSNIEQPGVDKSALDEMSIVWTNAGGTYIDGDLCYITFKVSENADKYISADKRIPVALIKKSDGDIISVDYQNIYAELVSGSIVVSDVEDVVTTVLENSIRDAEAYLSKDEYTAESIAKLKDVVDAAKQVCSNEASSQEEVDKAVSVIDNAIVSLTVKSFYVYVEKANRTSLDTGYRMIDYNSGFSEAVVADEGYEITQITVNDKPVFLVNGVLKISDIRENKVVNVKTAAKKYTVSAGNTQHGALKLSSSTVSYGKSCTVTVIPDEGYIIKDLLVNNQSVGAYTEYVIENIKDNITVSAEFAKQDKPITVTASVRGEGGRISPIMSIVNKGDPAFFVLLPDYGYDIGEKAYVNNDEYDVIGGMISLPSVTVDNTRVEAVFEKKSYKVTVICNEGGTVSIGGALTKSVLYMDTVDVEITPVSEEELKYKLQSVFVNGVPTKASIIKGKLVCRVTITDDTEISVKFMKDIPSTYKNKVARNGLPSDVTADNARDKREVFTALAEEYAGLTVDEKTVCSGAYATVLAVLDKANAYIMLEESGIEDKITELLTVTEINASNVNVLYDEVKNIKADYDSLTVMAKSLLSYDLKKQFDAFSVKVDECKKKTDGKFNYLYNMINNVPVTITMDNLGKAYTQLKRAEDMYRSLSDAEQKAANQEKIQFMHSQTSAVMLRIYEWYVNPFVYRVNAAKMVEVTDTIELAESKRTEIYDITSEYDLFAGYIRALIPENTVVRMDELYATANSMVSEEFEGQSIEASGDIDVEAELLVQPSDKPIADIIDENTAIDKAMDISLVKNSVEVQPNSKIRIKVPIDDYVAQNEPYVMYVDDYNNAYDVQARVVEENGQKYLVWNTDHFSCFVTMYKSNSDGISFDRNDFPEAGQKITATVAPAISMEGCTLMLVCYNADCVKEFVEVANDGETTVTATVTADTAAVRAMLWTNSDIEPIAYAQMAKEE